MIAPGWLEGLFGDAEMAALWSAETQMAQMLRFEAAFTRALAWSGRITPRASDAALARIEGFRPDPDLLVRDTRQDGVVVPGLVRQLRAGFAEPAALHTGATSQDVVDTVLALTLGAAADLVEARLRALIDRIDALDSVHGGETIMGRTRMQAARPVTARHRLTAWRAPLEAHLDRLAQLRPRACRLQLGGATGDLAELGADGPAIAGQLGTALGLWVPARCWHTDRTAIVEFGGFLALVAGSLGKIGQDIALMAQQGVGDIRLAGGGSSSAMAHKSNPVLAEVLVTLARAAGGDAGTLQGALVHEQERSGAAWMLEWLVLPRLAVTAGAALVAAGELLAQVRGFGPAA
jgi:3-carboxy-cis,cis-muconate cycloisomerase